MDGAPVRSQSTVKVQDLKIIELCILGSVIFPSLGFQALVPKFTGTEQAEAQCRMILRERTIHYQVVSILALFHWSFKQCLLPVATIKPWLRG